MPSWPGLALLNLARPPSALAESCSPSDSGLTRGAHKRRARWLSLACSHSLAERVASRRRRRGRVVRANSNECTGSRRPSMCGRRRRRLILKLTAAVGRRRLLRLPFISSIAYISFIAYVYSCMLNTNTHTHTTRIDEAPLSKPRPVASRGARLSSRRRLCAVSVCVCVWLAGVDILGTAGHLSCCQSGKWRARRKPARERERERRSIHPAEPAAVGRLSRSQPTAWLSGCCGCGSVAVRSGRLEHAFVRRRRRVSKGLAASGSATRSLSRSRSRSGSTRQRQRTSASTSSGSSKQQAAKTTSTNIS